VPPPPPRPFRSDYLKIILIAPVEIPPNLLRHQHPGLPLNVKNMIKQNRVIRYHLDEPKTH
jgi:hypothetical protein